MADYKGQTRTAYTERMRKLALEVVAEEMPIAPVIEQPQSIEAASKKTRKPRA